MTATTTVIDLNRPIGSADDAKRELRFLMRFIDGKSFARFVLELGGTVAVPGTVLAAYMGAPRDRRFGDPGAIARSERYLQLGEAAGLLRRKTVSFEGEELEPLEAFYLGPEKQDAFTTLMDIVSPP